MTEHRRLLEYWFYREKGFCPAGDEALGIFAGELRKRASRLARAGAVLAARSAVRAHDSCAAMRAWSLRSAGVTIAPPVDKAVSQLSVLHR